MSINLIKWFFIIGIAGLTAMKIIWGLHALQFLGCVAILLAISLLLCAIQLGCFKKIVIAEGKFPGFRYLYLETQGTLSRAAASLSSKVDDIGELIDPEDPNLRFVGMYFEHSSMLQDESKMRVCWGFAFLNKESENKYKQVIEKLKEKGASEKQIPEFTYAYGSLPFHFVLSFIVAVKKIYPVLFEYLKTHYMKEYYEDAGIPYLHLPDMKNINIGFPIGKAAEEFKISTISPPPRNDKWKKAKENYKLKTN